MGKTPADSDDLWAWVSVDRPTGHPAEPLEPPAWVSARTDIENRAETPRGAPVTPVAAPPERVAPATLAPARAAAKPVATPAMKRRRRKRLRKLGVLLLVAGVLGVSGYFTGTRVYAHLQQDQPGGQPAAADQSLGPTEGGAGEGDLIPTGGAPGSFDDPAAAETDGAAAGAAEAENRAQLAAFRAAADAYAATVGAGQQVGRIVIPKIGLDVAVLESTDKGFLKEGPGHWPETLFPGQASNFVVSGHRTTYGAPFYRLHELEAGDQIELAMPYGVMLYAVTRVVIVYPEDVYEVRNLGREQISLVACHPIGSAKQRIVVQGDLVSFLLTDRQYSQN